jgi:hypothetical protein
MKNRELSRQIQILNNLFDKTSEATGGDIEFQSHWAKYLCILCAGFLENALSEIYVSFSSGAASPHVVSFTRKALSQITNPNTTRFIEITLSFDKTWGSNLKDFVEDNGRKDAIDSIMSQRHRIAHGKNSDITVVRLREYLKKAIEVIEFLEKQCG